MRNNYSARMSLRKLLRHDAVVEITGLSKSTLWRLERRGKFPKRVRVGRGIAWFADDIEKWLEQLERGPHEQPDGIHEYQQQRQQER